ncbi:MAG: crossover junction endodeoxyribonuclease RuvC [Pseudomonadota bacterium]
MIVMGIDPGSRVAGFGIIAVDGSQLRCLDGGSIRLGSDDLGERLSALFTELTALIARHRPTVVAIERVFVYKNVDSALKLGQARGVAILSAALHQVPIFEYAATLIKQAVTGTGAAKKTQVALMVHHLLRLTQAPQADTADALAVALCHIHRYRLGTTNDRLSEGNTRCETTSDDHTGRT